MKSLSKRLALTISLAATVPSTSSGQVTLDNNGNIIRSPQASEYSKKYTPGHMTKEGLPKVLQSFEDTPGNYWAVSWRYIGEGWAAAAGSTKKKQEKMPPPLVIKKRLATAQEPTVTLQGYLTLITTSVLVF